MISLNLTIFSHFLINFLHWKNFFKFLDDLSYIFSMHSKQGFYSARLAFIGLRSTSIYLLDCDNLRLTVIYLKDDSIIANPQPVLVVITRHLFNIQLYLRKIFKLVNF